MKLLYLNIWIYWYNLEKCLSISLLLNLRIKKTVNSAIANAENNYQYDIDNLYIKEAFVGKSIVLKRFRARAKGRASGIKKPYSNITIILSEGIKNKKELHGTKS